MTKLDDLKALHKDLNQMGNRVSNMMTQVSTSFPNDAADINGQLETVGSAIEITKALVRGLAGSETMKNGGSAP